MSQPKEYTAKELQHIYQLAYAHGASKQPPLDNHQVIQLIEIERNINANKSD